MRRGFISLALFLGILALSLAWSTSFVKAESRTSTPNGIFDFSVDDGSAVSLTGDEWQQITEEYPMEDLRSLIINGRIGREHIASVEISASANFLLDKETGLVIFLDGPKGLHLPPGSSLDATYREEPEPEPSIAITEDYGSGSRVLWVVPIDCPLGDYPFTIEAHSSPSPPYPHDTATVNAVIHVLPRWTVPEFPFGTALLTSLATCAYLLSRKKQW